MKGLCLYSTDTAFAQHLQHWALTLSVPELLCYSTILIVIHFHNLAYFEG